MLKVYSVNHERSNLNGFPRKSCDTLGWKTVFLFKYSAKFEHFNIVLNQKNLVPSVFYDYDHILPQEALLF